MLMPLFAITTVTIMKTIAVRNALIEKHRKLGKLKRESSCPEDSENVGVGAIGCQS